MIASRLYYSDVTPIFYKKMGFPGRDYPYSLLVNIINLKYNDMYIIYVERTRRMVKKKGENTSAN